MGTDPNFLGWEYNRTVWDTRTASTPVIFALAFNEALFDAEV